MVYPLPEANETNFKLINEFVAWYKKLTGRDMRYSVYQGQIEFHDDIECEYSESTYVCDCGNEDDDEYSDCDECKDQAHYKKNNTIFRKVVEDVANVTLGNGKYIMNMDWIKVKESCTISFKDEYLLCVNKETGKGISICFNKYKSFMNVEEVVYFIGPFGLTLDVEYRHMISDADDFVKVIFNNDPEMMRAYVIHCLKRWLDCDEPSTVDMSNNSLKIERLYCDSNTLKLSGCVFLPEHVEIDSSFFCALCDAVKQFQEQGERRKVEKMEREQKQLEQELEQEEKKYEEQNRKRDAVAAKIATKRAMVENYKKAKLDKSE